jgi:hypothetical protein
MKMLKFALGLALMILLGFGVLLVVARFSDGPLAIIAGGPLISGELVSDEATDWSFVRDVPTVEFQLLEPPRSRTTWILEHAGRIFIPCGYMNTVWGRLWKQWPVEAERDPRAILRVANRRYPRRLKRIQEGPLVPILVAELNRKYAAGMSAEDVESGSLWFFELEPQGGAESRQDDQSRPFASAPSTSSPPLALAN